MFSESKKFAIDKLKKRLYNFFKIKTKRLSMENTSEPDLSKKLDRLLLLARSLSGKLAVTEMGREADLLLETAKDLQAELSTFNDTKTCLWQFQLLSGEWVVYPKKLTASEAGKIWHKKLDIVRGRRVKCIIPDDSKHLKLK